MNNLWKNIDEFVVSIYNFNDQYGDNAFKIPKENLKKKSNTK